MKIDLLNEIKNKRFIATSKDFKHFDDLYELKEERLIKNKSKHEYQLTKEGYIAANMGYDKYIQSLDLESNQSFKRSATKTTNTLNPKAKTKLTKGFMWFWTLISENALISTIIVAIIFYLINLIFDVDLK